MAQEIECEGYGIAWDEDDQDCLDCGVGEDCKAETEGEEVPKKKAAPKAAAKRTTGKAAGGAAEKTAGKKTASKAAPKEVELTVEERLDAIEARVADIEADLAGTSPRKRKGGKAKTSVAEKAEIKNKLTSAGPYKKEALDEMPARDVKRYASGLEINSFGKSKDAVVAECIKAQKSAAGKKLIKAAQEAVEGTDDGGGEDDE